jgi:hypothetical protein
MSDQQPGSDVSKPSEVVERALFEDLEGVARAFISRATGPRERMYELLTNASLAHAEGRYADARAMLGELHYLALHGGEA